MKKKLTNVKSDVKSDQLSMISMVNKILRDINFVKSTSLGGEDAELFNLKNTFEGELGASVYFVGHDMLADSDNGLIKRTEIELRKHADEMNREDQSLCHIYQTTSWGNNECRRPNAAKDVLITVVTPKCSTLDQNQNIQKTVIKTKNGLLNVEHTEQEIPRRFINYLFYTVNSSIRDAVFERENNREDATKILEFVSRKGK